MPGDYSTKMGLQLARGQVAWQVQQYWRSPARLDGGRGLGFRVRVSAPNTPMPAKGVAGEDCGLGQSVRRGERGS